MSKLVIGAALAFCALAAMPPWRGPYATQQQSTQQQSEVRTVAEQQSAIKLGIMTGGGLFGPQKDRYRAGERIPVSIAVTNISDDPVQVCVSGTLYQDRPQLLRDGQPVTYSQPQMLRASQVATTCSEEDLPEPIEVQPKESKVVDWFILVEGNDPAGDIAWYESLRPGKYELTLQRRLGCCGGPTIESNKISFEVVP